MHMCIKIAFQTFITQIFKSSNYFIHFINFHGFIILLNSTYHTSQYNTPGSNYMFEVTLYFYAFCFYGGHI